MFSRLFRAVQVVTLLTSTCFAIGAEQFRKLVEEVGFRTEVGEVLPCRERISHRLLHRHALIAVVAIAFHHCRGNAFTREDVLEGALDRAGSSSRGTGDSYYRVTLRHRRKD